MPKDRVYLSYSCLAGLTVDGLVSCHRAIPKGWILSFDELSDQRLCLLVSVDRLRVCLYWCVDGYMRGAMRSVVCGS
jgi:hypothetical protein